MLRGLPFTKLHRTWSVQSTTTSSGLLLRAAPPELRVWASAPLELPGSSCQIPARSHSPVHLLHVYAEDEYYECTRVT
jgi:hypothetical protein